MPYIKFVKYNKKSIIIKISKIEKGFGNIIASIIRKIIIKKTMGYSPIYIKINETPHEFTYAKEIVEDNLEILKRLKEIKFILKNCKSIKINIKAKGPKKIYTKDIEIIKYCKVISNNKIFITINPNQKLNLEIKIIKGIGFSFTNNLLHKKKRNTKKNKIYIDTYFSTIKRIRYKIIRKKYDSIIIKINTTDTSNLKNIINLTYREINKNLNPFQKYISTISLGSRKLIKKKLTKKNIKKPIRKIKLLSHGVILKNLIKIKGRSLYIKNKFIEKLKKNIKKKLKEFGILQY